MFCIAIILVYSCPFILDFPQLLEIMRGRTELIEKLNVNKSRFTKHPLLRNKSRFTKHSRPAGESDASGNTKIRYLPIKNLDFQLLLTLFSSRNQESDFITQNTQIVLKSTAPTIILYHNINAKELKSTEREEVIIRRDLTRRISFQKILRYFRRNFQPWPPVYPPHIAHSGAAAIWDTESD